MPATLEPAAATDALARGDRFEQSYEAFVYNTATPPAEVPDDVSARTYRATFRSVATDAILADTAGGTATVTKSVGANGTVTNRVTVAVADTTGWPVDQVKWDLEETTPGVTGPQTLIRGTIDVLEDQSR